MAAGCGDANGVPSQRPLSGPCIYFSTTLAVNTLSNALQYTNHSKTTVYPSQRRFPPPCWHAMHTVSYAASPPITGLAMSPTRGAPRKATSPCSARMFCSRAFHKNLRFSRSTPRKFWNLTFFGLACVRRAYARIEEVVGRLVTRYWVESRIGDDVILRIANAMRAVVAW